MLHRFGAARLGRSLASADVNSQGEDHGGGATRKLTLPVEVRPLICPLRDPDDYRSIIASGVPGTQTSRLTERLWDGGVGASVRSMERLCDVFASELHDAWRDRFAYNNELSNCNG
jgi:hypothetical protein